MTIDTSLPSKFSSNAGNGFFSTSPLLKTDNSASSDRLDFSRRH